ncbi:hypothetical protein HS041_36760 [Planomonospora sp. ID67723]|uniref:hypothetical protein n=1 Tax=Planomonospora sp. ID67723 TaxID=2738134 RepID=UPI0018C404E1|nr:hypothetical protein [Planomonospora sp. ID67723]MBG0833255.1 hypothetical protein [Planomonospora sp. ID67723]
MSGGRKARITITVDPDVVEYAEHLVASGKATSVAAVFNDAIAAKRIGGATAKGRLRRSAPPSTADAVRLRAGFRVLGGRCLVGGGVALRA